MKGIILAGGHGTRLYPLTVSVSKQLLPVYDKPMVYYPLSILMLADIRDILIISTTEALPHFQKLLGTGDQFGVSFSYLKQDQPRGIAEALLIGSEFIGESPVCLILGDNIFYGTSLPERLQRASQIDDGALVFAYQVREPQHYAVVTFDYENGETGLATSIDEKPQHPKSNYAVPGLYFYDNKVVEIVNDVKPSNRGELEITDLNRKYLESGKLSVEVLGRGVAWLDAGTHASLVQATNFVQTVQDRQGMMISCPEEIAYLKGYIDSDMLLRQAEKLKNNSYGEYLFKVLEVGG
ncbi:MAG: glucose-1-phosphate thymidylyltransferase RfbA [Anaerolineales bacterium]|nr:glucose-1-phosphate thymidylyltransferase RfbA [Chloroflexota bacterium]MBL6980986.1 glucose-1-phosphate thymidylyltransferase RfbA [Anaerolineales bacterium]